ncbi:MAG: HEAT repeat domain-containing protein [Treponema sp.]|jgi:HEAT repeat protein|nr:HEAT repeat domain-containing protein [Treponema sp.]
MTLKRFFILIIAALITAPAVMGQSGNSNSDSEKSVEEAYLEEAIEMMIIRETSRTDSREQKLIALEYIGNALERGSTNDEIRTTLEFLSVEGTQNQVRERRRLMNDYPEVRRQAARLLGTLGTPEAKSALIRICTTENEPMVLQEAVKSLGTIGTNDNNDAVNAIVWIANRFNYTTAPDNLLALAAVDSLDKIAQKNNGIREPAAIHLLIRIAEGSYAPPVRERARQALVDLRKYTAEGMREEREKQQQQQQQQKTTQ